MLELLPSELDPALAAWAFGLSVATFVLGLVAVPIVIARMPEDYFVRTREERRSLPRRHPVGRMLGLAAKNVLGALLLLAGVAMLVLPGQGLLTILAALSLLSFPGKRRFERRLLGTRPLRLVVQAIRRRAGQPPLQL